MLSRCVAWDYSWWCDQFWVLACFEALSGLKINFHKTDLVPINLPEADINQFAQIFCCKIGSFPFKYLGVPLHFGKLRREDIQPIIDRIIKKISGGLANVCLTELN